MPNVLFRLTLMIAAGLLVAACVPASPPGTAATAPPVAPPAAAASPSAAAASPAPSASAAAAATTIQLTDSLKFDPATVTVPRGSTITWRNASQVAHTVTDDASKAAKPEDAALPSGAQSWDSGTLNAGQTYSHTFDVPGTYKYFCQPHEAAGMVGTIIVNP